MTGTTNTELLAVDQIQHLTEGASVLRFVRTGKLYVYRGFNDASGTVLFDGWSNYPNRFEYVGDLSQDATPDGLSATLLGALEPFAKAGRLFSDVVPEGGYVESIYSPAAGAEYNINGDHLRAARDAVDLARWAQDSEGAGVAVCNCGGVVEGWVCQSCGVTFREVNGELIAERPAPVGDGEAREKAGKLPLDRRLENYAVMYADHPALAAVLREARAALLSANTLSATVSCPLCRNAGDLPSCSCHEGGE